MKKEKHDKPKEKEAKKDPKDAKIEELTDTCQRLQADFDNFRKRLDKEKSSFTAYAKESLVNELLPILDSFELGLKHTMSPEDFKKGTEMVYAQFISLLEKEGLKRIDALGKQFDPHQHEVLLKQESEKDNIILEELQKGYLFKDHVLRHTKVKIGEKKEEIKEEKKK